MVYSIVIINSVGKLSFKMYTEPEWLLYDLSRAKKLLQNGDLFKVEGV